MRNTITSLVAALILLPLVTALAGDPGSAGFTWLKVPWGAKHAGMADAGVALPSGIWGAHQNPASLAKVDYPQIGFMHQEYIFDTRREFVATAVPTGIGNVSAGLDFFKVGDLEYRNGATEEPLGLFDAQDYAWFLGYGLTIRQRLSLGVTGKYVAEKVETETADAICFDFGAVWQVNKIINVGAAVRSLGSKPQFKAEKIDLPTTVSAGVGVSLERTTIGADVSFPKDADVRFSLGAERYLADLLALRAGYKIGYDEENISFGLGISKSIWQVDYAFVPYGSGLGSSHRLALTVYWR